MNKYIGIGITLLLTALAFAVTFGTIKQKVDYHEEELIRHDVKIDRAAELNVQQSVILERTVATLEKLEAKF